MVATSSLTELCTLWANIQVILIAIKNVVVRSGINSATLATMEAYNGNN